MKIRFILKENSGTVSLSKNPENMNLVNMVKKVLGSVDRKQSINYGWLYPNGSSSVFNPTQFIHGQVMQILEPDYAANEKSSLDREIKLIEQGPLDFGLMTGSLRIAAYGKFEIFTQITPDQLAWIRRHRAGSGISIFLRPLGRSIEIPEMSLSSWNQKLNQELIDNGVASFNVLAESKKR